MYATIVQAQEFKQSGPLLLHGQLCIVYGNSNETHHAQLHSMFNHCSFYLFELVITATTDIKLKSDISYFLYNFFFFLPVISYLKPVFLIHSFIDNFITKDLCMSFYFLQFQTMFLKVCTLFHF